MLIINYSLLFVSPKPNSHCSGTLALQKRSTMLKNSDGNLCTMDQKRIQHRLHDKLLCSWAIVFSHGKQTRPMALYNFTLDKNNFNPKQIIAFWVKTWCLHYTFTNIQGVPEVMMCDVWSKVHTFTFNIFKHSMKNFKLQAFRIHQMRFYIFSSFWDIWCHNV